jgi:hypothetical protein
MCAPDVVFRAIADILRGLPPVLDRSGIMQVANASASCIDYPTRTQGPQGESRTAQLCRRPAVVKSRQQAPYQYFAFALLSVAVANIGTVCSMSKGRLIPGF